MNTINKNKTTLVYGVDELHITGLPTDEKGYTIAGQYSRWNELPWPMLSEMVNSPKREYFI